MKFLFSLFSILSLGWVDATCQTAPGKYWVRFTDKENSPYSVSDPAAFLSPKCIERRVRFGLGFDARDIPVNVHYINTVLDKGAQLHNRSKWFNAITVVLTDSTLVDTLLTLPFVAEVKSLHVSPTHVLPSKFFEEENFLRSATTLDAMHCDEEEIYGPSYRQIEMLNGHVLHELGYTGVGIDVAVLDAGFFMADKLPAFDALRSEGRLKMTRDFAYHNVETVYTLSTHGMYVLSLMTGDIPDSLLGTAPGANYYLFRCEDPASEYPVEEDNWVAAAEVCDSLGIDIINSSLGYSLFDDPSMSHSYSDMDGNTTRCSIAADIAAEKGILVVNSAGNSGDDPWHYITAPSDGDSVLCVGAVRSNRTHATFSSYGPSADGDVKPNVSAMGQACVIAETDSTIRTGNGTSFSSPILAGMAACLMQAFPLRSNMEIFRAIEASAHMHHTPTDSLGYGIPDFWKAYLLLQGNTQPYEGELYATVFPNPCTDYLNVVVHVEKPCKATYEIYDAAGRHVFSAQQMVESSELGVLRLDEALHTLAAGRYTLYLQAGDKHTTLGFVIMHPGKTE